MTEEMAKIEKNIGRFALLVCAALFLFTGLQLAKRAHRAEKSLQEVAFDMSVKMEEYCRSYCVAAGGGAVLSYFSSPEEEGVKYRVECQCLKPEGEE